MIVNIEFFSRDFLQNVVTCLKCKVDKVIFIGYPDVMTENAKNRHIKLLKKIADINTVEFISVGREEMSDIKFKLNNAVEEELGKGNQVFFDLTGGEDLVLVAAGMMATKHNIPVKRTDIKNDRVIEYSAVFFEKEYMPDSIREKSLTIEDYVYMQGACINDNYAKSYKQHRNNAEYNKTIEKLWELRKKYDSKWNSICMIIAELRKYFEGNSFKSDFSVITPHIEKRYVSRDEFTSFLCDMYDNKLITGLDCSGNSCKFTALQMYTIDFLCDPGCILELYMHLIISRNSLVQECEIGVHIDWDGRIQSGDKKDVLNEIDIMMIKDNKPVFVSCKNGRVENEVLYELDSVARAVGGKYGKKILITMDELQEVFLLRAKEMGIGIIDKRILTLKEAGICDCISRMIE